MSMMAPGGGPGGPGGGPGGGSGTLAASDFTTEIKGAESFLSALASKDPKRLAEATAKRAEFEAANDHKPVFKDILAEAASAEDLDKLARLFAGMKVVSASRKSSGTASVVVGKQEETSSTTRSLIVRKEKDGWKVQDFGRQYVAKSPSMNYGTGRNGTSKPKAKGG